MDNKIKKNKFSIWTILFIIASLIFIILFIAGRTVKYNSNQNKTLKRLNIAI